MLKHFLSTTVGILSAIVLASPITSFAASYDVMGLDGKVTSIEDDTIDQIVDNIKKNDGEEAANAYIEAMATGSYKDFYKIVNNDMETNRRSEYMQIDGKDVSGNPANDPQEIEMWIQTIIGPESTAVETGKAAKEAGFDDNLQGLNDYFLGILMETAERPSYAKNPVYRISELRLPIPSTMEEAELYANEGIIVEHDAEPLTELQHQIIDNYGFTIMSEAEFKAGSTQTVDEPDKETDLDEVVVEEKEVTIDEPEKTVFSLSSTQFILITIIAVTLAVLVTVIIIRKK